MILANKEQGLKRHIFLQCWWSAFQSIQEGSTPKTSISATKPGQLLPALQEPESCYPKALQGKKQKGILSVGKSQGRGAPADYSISHTTPCPAHFIHILQISGNHLKALYKHTHSSKEPATGTKTEISKRSYR